MRSRLTIILPLALVFSLLTKFSLGQITTTIGAVSNACVGDTVTVPVNVVMNPGISVAAISMSIDFDTTKLQCLMFGSGAAAQAAQNINPAIANGFLSNVTSFANLNPNPPYNGTTRRQFRAAWFNLVPVAFNGLMYNMRFLVLAPITSPSTIIWDLTTPGNCEYADEFADVINVPASGWLNGALSSAGAPAAITAQPSGNVNLTAGDNTTLTVSATGAQAYQWQVLTSGASWTNLTNTAPYSGVTGASLTITAAPTSLNGNQYRVLVTGGCGSPVTSNALTLSVTGANTVGFSATNVSGCQGDTVSVPLNANGLSGVTAMSLKLNLPSGATYVGLSGLAPGLTSATGSVLAGQLTVAWTGSAFTLASGTLMNVRLVLPALSGALAWDNSTSVTPNATLSFTPGTLTVTPLPTITTQPPATLTVGEFASTTLTVVATNATSFRWQKQSGNGTWANLQDGLQYSGTTTPVLSIPSAVNAMNNGRFRVVMLNGTCPASLTSSVCTLSVTPMQITLNAVGTTACAGDTVIVPVVVSGANNISLMSIYLQYNSSNLQYLGFDSALNAGISVTTQTSPSARLFISYTGSSTITFNQSRLARIRFRALGASPLTWAPASDFANAVGDTVAYTQITGTSSQVGVTQALVTAAGPTSFCTGGSVVLNGTAVTGATYQWLNGGSVIAGATNVSYTANAAGSYRFFLSVPGGCSDTSSPVLVTTSAPPVATITASGPTTFCQGQSVGLVATRGTGFTYRWYRDNVRITSLAPNTDSIGALLGGTYRVVVVNSTNCADSFATGIVVTVKPRPRAPQISRPTVPPASDTLYASIRNQNNITWYRNGVAQTGGADGALRITANGIYRAIQDSNGCRSDSSNAIIVTGVGIENQELNDLLLVFPNPCAGELTVKGDFDLQSLGTRFTVRNMLGQVVFEDHDDQLQGNFTKILPLQSLASGSYSLSVVRGGNIGVFRFVRD